MIARTSCFTGILLIIALAPFSITLIEVDPFATAIGLFMGKTCNQLKVVRSLRQDNAIPLKALPDRDIHGLASTEPAFTLLTEVTRA